MPRMADPDPWHSDGGVHAVSEGQGGELSPDDEHQLDLEIRRWMDRVSVAVGATPEDVLGTTRTSDVERARRGDD